ncbi:hypothetical protein ACP4OV_002002 [Aristida adscensionis]
MADPVASVEKIVRIGLQIRDAVDTARRNEEECRDIMGRALRFGAVLTQLRQAGVVGGSPATSGALEELEGALRRALELVRQCRRREAHAAVRRLFAAGDLARQLRRARDDVLDKVMLASFALNAQATIVLLATHQPPPRLQQDTGLMEMSYNTGSADDSRSQLSSGENNVLVESEAPCGSLVASRKFSLSELKTALSGGNIIGKGGSCEVYKGVLNDGNMVAIKKYAVSFDSSAGCTYAQFLVSNLQHKNIVRILGYGYDIEPRLKRKYILVEEYIPNGSLDKIIKESRLDLSSLFRIIEGVAQGLHYLHEHDIIHGAVKPGNILLDFDMNPKIIDFDLPNTIDGHWIYRGKTGYFDPEYMIDPIMSWKIDVYAFGMMVLEMVTSIYRSKTNRELPLRQWFGKAQEGGARGLYKLLDQMYVDKSQRREIKRCMEVGLLCAHFDGSRRPTMLDVLEMLNGEKYLPKPGLG